MSSRSITSVVTPDTIALNAAIFGYAGHSILTPHQAIKQIWWTDERIDAKVTPEFIVSKLRNDERYKLEHPLAFGNALTDDTYLQWILGKAKRFFLILVEIGVPDQIFGIIDDCWDDDDLPIPQWQIKRLALSYKNNDELNRKFYSTQFTFLLRPLKDGAHIEYADNEVIPLDFVHRLPPAAALQHWFRLHLPEKPDEVLVRRKVTLGSNGEIDAALEDRFLQDVDTARTVQHKHIASIWASYTSKDTGYYITPFQAEHTLRSFIDFRMAASLTKLSKAERNSILLTWLHCLADALTAIHDEGLYHSAITPTNLVIDGQNEIAFCDIGSLRSFQSDKKADPAEAYNYSAPENHASSTLTFLASLPEDYAPSQFSHTHSRKMSADSKFSTSDRSRQSSHYSQISDRSHFSDHRSVFSDDYNPPSLIYSKSNSTGSETSLAYPKTPPNEPFHPSRPPPPLPKDPQYVIVPSLALLSSEDGIKSALPRQIFSPTSPRPSVQYNSPCYLSQQADIFSLGCIFMDILTYMSKRKPGEFLKHRSTKLSRRFGASKSASNSALATAGLVPDTAQASATANAAAQLPAGARVDASFHANVDKLLSWMVVLETDASAATAAASSASSYSSSTTSPVIDEAPAYRAVPALLRLVRAMLHQNPLMRPRAADVRDKLLDVLVSYGGIERLCCTGRRAAPRVYPLRERCGKRKAAAAAAAPAAQQQQQLQLQGMVQQQQDRQRPVGYVGEARTVGGSIHKRSGSSGSGGTVTGKGEKRFPWSRGKKPAFVV
jgi:hypothetical protein